MGVVRVEGNRLKGKDNGGAVDLHEAADVEQLLASHDGSDYVEAVVELAEQSDRNYRAALMAGRVVNGFSDSTNY